MRTKSKEITEIEKRLLAAYKQFQAVHGLPPSIRDLMSLTGTTSSSVVRFWLIRLEERGYVQRMPYISRGIILTPAGMSASF